MAHYVYRHGLPFDKTLGLNISDLVGRIEAKKASLIINDGGVGEGKSTVMVHEADYINKLYGLPPVSLNIKDHPQLATGGEEFLEKLRVCYDRKLPTLIYDEAGDFNRRGALTRFNALLNRTFETFRGFKILIILGLPSFHVLDNDLFDKNIPRLLLHLYGRKENYGNFKAYSLYRMMYVKDRMKKLVVKPFAYDLVNSCFRGQFLDLPPERAKLLDAISMQGKLKALYKAEVKVEGLVNYADIGNKLGRSIHWARGTIYKLKIRPKKTINKLKYFDENILNILADWIDDHPQGKPRK